MRSTRVGDRAGEAGVRGDVPAMAPTGSTPTTAEELIAAGFSVGYAVSIAQSPGTGYHHTVQVPFPLPLDLAVALSAVFTQRPNPACLQDSEA